MKMRLRFVELRIANATNDVLDCSIFESWLSEPKSRDDLEHIKKCNYFYTYILYFPIPILGASQVVP